MNSADSGLLPINQIARKLGLGDDDLELYGRLTAKVRLNRLPQRNAPPRDWRLTVTDAHLAGGAGFIVVVAGNMMLMPGLSPTPQAVRMDVDKEGKITGLS